MSHFTARFDASFTRRMPDPVFEGAQRYFMMMPVENVLDGLPKDPNPREQRIDRGIYKDIKQSLLNELGTRNTFHLKNKGITLYASKVDHIEGDTYDVVFDEGDGTLDGGHTYEIIRSARDRIEELLDDDADMHQHVLVQVYVGYPRELVPELAGGLNTAVQVQEMSLAELRDDFDWIKEAVGDTEFIEHIAFKENEIAPYDARDIVVALDVFNIELWPNDKDEYPVRAFQSKAKVLEAYLKNRESYQRLTPIVKDILVLYETISKEARHLHNAAGGKGGKLAFVDTKKRGKYDFPFIEAQDDARLTRGALLPMLGAFRWMVTTDADGNFVWRTSFDDVLALWREVGAELMKATQATSDDLSKQPNLIGKSRNHWATLHSTVAKRQLMAMAS